MWDYRCVDFLVGLLADPMCAVGAFDALAAWLSEPGQTRKVEAILQRGANIELIRLGFQQASPAHLESIMESAGIVLATSDVMNKAIGSCDAFVEALLLRLQHPRVKPTLRVLLLKGLISLFKHHDRPQQMVAKFALPQVIERLRGDRAIMVAAHAKQFDFNL